MRLIVTEKNNSAKKIAEILSGGTAKEEASFKTPYYTWGKGDDAQMTIGLKGHVLNPAFHALTADDFEVIELEWGQLDFPDPPQHVRIVG